MFPGCIGRVFQKFTSVMVGTLKVFALLSDYFDVLTVGDAQQEVGAEHHFSCSGRYCGNWFSENDVELRLTCKPLQCGGGGAANKQPQNMKSKDAKRRVTESADESLLVLD